MGHLTHEGFDFFTFSRDFGFKPASLTESFVSANTISVWLKHFKYGI